MGAGSCFGFGLGRVGLGRATGPACGFNVRIEIDSVFFSRGRCFLGRLYLLIWGGFHTGGTM